MHNSNQSNNCCFLCGRVCTPPAPSHSVYGERFYRMEIEVPRLSRQVDVLPLTVSGRALTRETGACGALVAVEGQIRSYNKMQDGKSRLIISVFARSIQCIDRYPDDPNRITLEGYVCNRPFVSRQPLLRQVRLHPLHLLGPERAHGRAVHGGRAGVRAGPRPEPGLRQGPRERADPEEACVRGFCPPHRPLRRAVSFAFTL